MRARSVANAALDVPGAVDGSARRVAVAAAIVLGLIGATLLFVAASSPGAIRAQLERVAEDGSVSPGLAAAILGRSAIYGLVLLAFSALTWRFGGWRGEARSPRRPWWQTRREGLVFGALLAAAIAIRGPLLSLPPPYDEAGTFTEFVFRSPLFFLSRYTHPNNHVFHSLLVWLMPGDSMLARRAPAFLAGLAVVAVTWKLARDRHGRTAAPIAAAIAATATPLVEFSAQARGYTILTLCVCLLFLLGDRLGEGTNWISAAVLLALGAWTIPVMLFPAVGWSAWLVVSRRRTPWPALARAAGGAAALTLVVYLPILVVSGLRSITSNGNVSPLEVSALLPRLPLSALETWRFWTLSFGAIGGFAAGLLSLRSFTRRGPFAVVACTSVLTVLVLRRDPFARVWTFLLPLFAVAVAGGASWLLERQRRAFAASSVVALLVTVVAGREAVQASGRADFYNDPAIASADSAGRWAAERLDAKDRVLVLTPLDAPYQRAFADAGVTARLVVFRFDSDPEVVRAEFLGTRRWVVVSDRPGAMSAYESLGVAGSLAPVERFPNATIYRVGAPAEATESESRSAQR